jgi:hydrogenase maturation factor
VPADHGGQFVIDWPGGTGSDRHGRHRPAGRQAAQSIFWADLLAIVSPSRIPSVIVGPSVGEDTAAVDIDGDPVLVLKSDPITFATESIGRYAVLVNANDLATAGAEARWMLATLLLPCGFSRIPGPRRVRRPSCRLPGASRITLCGGHTEITDAVRRPVVVGMMAGTVAREDLIRKARGWQPGDRVLVTKGVAVEGTAIIAAEFQAAAAGKGHGRRGRSMPAATIPDMISIAAGSS